MKGQKLGLLIFVAILALVTVASAALPASVTATITHPDPYVSTTPYWIVDITAGGNADLPDGLYDGYCADGTSTMITTTEFPLYDSRYPASLPLGIQSADWNKINYILNNQQGADEKTLQALFWWYSNSLFAQLPFDYDQAKFDAIRADANANGGSFVPTAAGQRYAVIVWNPAQVQLAFIDTVVPTIPGPEPVPEFPTLALPVAMMLGFVFIVYVVKGRNE